MPLYVADYRHKIRHGFYAPHDDHIARHWKAGVFYEANGGQLLDVIFRQRRRGVFIDVGAHWGNHSAFLMLSGFTAGHAFEPNAASFEVLQTNAEAFPGLMLYPMAIGSYRGRAGTKDGPPGNTGMAKLTRGDTVDVATIDSQNIAPDLIKIDAEGMELEVLAGAAETIARHRPLVACEVLHDEGTIDAFFEALGYAPPQVTTNHTRTKLYVP